MMPTRLWLHAFLVLVETPLVCFLVLLLFLALLLILFSLLAFLVFLALLFAAAAAAGRAGRRPRILVGECKQTTSTLFQCRGRCRCRVGSDVSLMGVACLHLFLSEDAVFLGDNSEHLTPNWVWPPVLGQCTFLQHIDVVALLRPCYRVKPHLLASMKGLVSEHVAVANVRPSRNSVPTVGMN